MTVDEGLFVTIHGVDQWVTIRGSSSANPVLMLISGAGVALSAMAPLFAAWEGEFTLVQWDQPAAGATYALNSDVPSGELSIDRLVRDGIAELTQIGPPPYPDAPTDAIKSKYASAMTPAERAAFGAVDPTTMAAMNSPPSDARYIARGVTLHDVRTRAMAAYTALRDEIVAFDARRLGLDFDVPMFFFQGDGDADAALVARVERPRLAHRPTNFGSRFSRNDRTPSFESSV